MSAPIRVSPIRMPPDCSGLLRHRGRTFVLVLWFNCAICVNYPSIQFGSNANIRWGGLGCVYESAGA